ncbi:MAG: hypothetical protein ACRC10_06235 [Thermoguttaceae bacterium]
MISRILAIVFFFGLCGMIFAVDSAPLIQEKDSSGKITTTTVKKTDEKVDLASPTNSLNSANTSGLGDVQPEQSVMEDEPSPFEGMHPAALQRMREELSLELRELSRVVNQIDPRDQRFMESLRTQQNTMLSQVKAIDSHLKKLGIDPSQMERGDNPFGDPRNMPGRRPNPNDPMMRGMPNDPRRMSSSPAPFGSEDVPGFGPGSGPGFGPETQSNRDMKMQQGRIVGSDTSVLSPNDQDILNLADRLRAMGMNDAAEVVLAQLKERNPAPSLLSPVAPSPNVSSPNVLSPVPDSVLSSSTGRPSGLNQPNVLPRTAPFQQGPFNQDSLNPFEGGNPFEGEQRGNLGQRSPFGRGTENPQMPFSPEREEMGGQMPGMPGMSGMPGPGGVFGPNPGDLARNPWEPPPSKEMVELKSQVSSLQNQIEQMQQQMKALEMQLQLLNQNILLKLGKTE